MTRYHPLTLEERAEIVRLRAAGLSLPAIARETGRARNTVTKALREPVEPPPVVVAPIVPWAPWVPEPEVCAELISELSPAERHALELLAAGYTPKQAARVREVTEKTLRNTLNAVVRRLDVSSYTQGLIVLRRAELA